ncbi:hypothetical protein CDAR_435041 [Caerostris darwini]|uniref:Uncharacterized protein n=1 Tax=Caerostris darwini TaxID=1538125 RepID=A0AAV4UJ14_9ARAC|nr:hypothetical protein CDAR_435041 [Caerostris darwini]
MWDALKFAIEDNQTILTHFSKICTVLTTTEFPDSSVRDPVSPILFAGSSNPIGKFANPIWGWRIGLGFHPAEAGVSGYEPDRCKVRFIP